MPVSTVLQLPSPTQPEACWFRLDSDPGARPGHGSLDDAARELEGERLLVLAPANDILRTSAHVPIKGQAKILNALPYALEDQLAADVDDLHFAAARADADGNVGAAVVHRERLEDWLEALSERGLEVDALHSVADAVPVLPSTYVIFARPDACIVRTPDGRTDVCDLANLFTLISLYSSAEEADEDGEDPMRTTHLMVYTTPELAESEATLWENLRVASAALELRLLEDDGIGMLADHIQRQPGINLLQGEYKPKREFSTDLTAWRLPGLLLGLFILLAGGLQVASLVELNRQEAALDAAIASGLQDVFPGIGEIRDARAQFLSRSRTVGGGGQLASGPGFVDVVRELSLAVRETQGLTMETANYRNGVLDLRLRAPDVSTLDQLIQKVGERGRFTATIMSANPRDDEVLGRVQVKAAP